MGGIFILGTGESLLGILVASLLAGFSDLLVRIGVVPGVANARQDKKPPLKEGKNGKRVKVLVPRDETIERMAERLRREVRGGGE